MLPNTPNPKDMPISTTLDQIKELINEYPFLGQLTLFDFLRPATKPAKDESHPQ